MIKSKKLEDWGGASSLKIEDILRLIVLESGWALSEVC